MARKLIPCTTQAQPCGGAITGTFEAGRAMERRDGKKKELNMNVDGVQGFKLPETQEGVRGRTRTVHPFISDAEMQKEQDPLGTFNLRIRQRGSGSPPI